ncbi:IS200/IS605-like element ISMac7 family transposase [soil metagenome]
MYHLVCPAKYRKRVFTESVESTLKEVCSQIEIAHEIKFIEIGNDFDHVHFLIQGVPILSPSKIAQIVKGVTSREIQKKHGEIHLILWGGSLWTSGFYINTVGQYASEDVIINYVKNQGRENEYKKIHSSQLQLF